jgi:hypothetical protein
MSANFHHSADVRIIFNVYHCNLDHGYAFSGEAGNAPEIVEKLARTTTRLVSNQRLMPTLNMGKL